MKYIYFIILLVVLFTSSSYRNSNRIIWEEILSYDYVYIGRVIEVNNNKSKLINEKNEIINVNFKNLNTVYGTKMKLQEKFCLLLTKSKKKYYHLFSIDQIYDVHDENILISSKSLLDLKEFGLIPQLGVYEEFILGKKVGLKITLPRMLDLIESIKYWKKNICQEEAEELENLELSIFLSMKEIYCKQKIE